MRIYTMCNALTTRTICSLVIGNQSTYSYYMKKVIGIRFVTCCIHQTMPSFLFKLLHTNLKKNLHFLVYCQASEKHFIQH